jgi:hypothetical protein
VTEDEVRGLFTVAGFETLAVRQLPNGYCGLHLRPYAEAVKVPRVYVQGETPLDYEALQFLNEAVRALREPWWFVKTRWGWIEIGWRKRVISICWADCAGPLDVTQDDVTKNGELVHAWSMVKAVEYLTTLREELQKRDAEPRT